jgi:hypothetical protein
MKKIVYSGLLMTAALVVAMGAMAQSKYKKPATTGAKPATTTAKPAATGLSLPQKNQLLNMQQQKIKSIR